MPLPNALQESLSYERLRNQMALVSLSSLQQIDEEFGLRAPRDAREFAMCTAQYQSGDLLSADLALQNFMSLHPHSAFHPRAQMLRAEIAFRRTSLDSAAHLYAAAYAENMSAYQSTQDSLFLRTAHVAAFWEATSFSLLGRYEDATQPYNNSLLFERGQYADDALFALGQIEEGRLNYDKAITYYRRVETEYPLSNVVLISKIRHAQCLLFLRESSNAITVLASAENTRQSVIESQEQTQASAKTIEAQNEFEESNRSIRYLRAEAMNQRALYDSALVEFNRVITDSNCSADLKYQSMLGAGWSSLNLKRWDEAVHYYDLIIDSTGNDESHSQAMARLYRSVAWKQRGNRDDAARELAFLSSSARYSQTALALLELGQMQYEDAHYDQARRSLERALHESPDGLSSLRITILLGAVYTQLQDWKHAISSYQNAEIMARKASVHAVPQRDFFIREAMFKRAICYVQDFQYREAISDLNAVVAAKSDDDRMDEILFWLAEAYSHAHLMKNAEETYQKILMNYGASKRREESYYGLGWVYFQTEVFDKAGSTFAKMLNEFPTSRFAQEVRNRVGDVQYKSKSYLEAAKTYREAYKMNPKEDQGQYAAFQIGLCLYRAKDYTNAITQLRSFVKNYPKSFVADHAQYTIGYIYTIIERHDDAISAFEELLRSYPNSEQAPAAMYYIANSFFAKGDYEQAATRFRSLMGLYPTTYFGIEALRGLQESLSALGRGDEAIEVGKSYVESNPDGAMKEQISMKTIELFMRKGDYCSAAKEYQEFLKKYPDSEYGAEALYFMAKSQLELNDADAARASFGLLFARYPKSDFAAKGLLQSAILELGRSDISKADSLFELVGRSFPSTELAAQAHFERAQMTMIKGDTAKALELFHASAQLHLGEYSYQALYRLGMFYRAHDLNDSARSYFAQIGMYQDNVALAAECYYRIGELYLTEKNYAKAAENFELVKSKFDGIEDWYTLSLINLGECYEKLGEQAKAKEVYQTIIILHPSDDYGKSAQSRLKRIGKN